MILYNYVLQRRWDFKGKKYLGIFEFSYVKILGKILWV